MIISLNININIANILFFTEINSISNQQFIHTLQYRDINLLSLEWLSAHSDYPRTWIFHAPTSVQTFPLNYSTKHILMALEVVRHT